MRRVEGQPLHTLAAALHDLNLAEAKGTGIRTMRRLAAEAGLTLPDDRLDAWRTLHALRPEQREQGILVGYTSLEALLERRTPLFLAGARSQAGRCFTQRKSIHVDYSSGSLCAGFDPVG